MAPTTSWAVKILEKAALPNVHAAKTMDEAAEKVVALAKEKQLDVDPRRQRHEARRRRYHRP